jgi:hypothetical protein
MLSIQTIQSSVIARRPTVESILTPQFLHSFTIEGHWRCFLFLFLLTFACRFLWEHMFSSPSTKERDYWLYHTGQCFSPEKSLPQVAPGAGSSCALSSPACSMWCFSHVFWVFLHRNILTDVQCNSISLWFIHMSPVANGVKHLFMFFFFSFLLFVALLWWNIPSHPVPNFLLSYFPIFEWPWCLSMYCEIYVSLFLGSSVPVINLSDYSWARTTLFLLLWLFLLL